MELNLTQKELLVMLDVILFAHMRFHRAEFSALVGTSDESREELIEKILNTLIDMISNKIETIKLYITSIDKDNILGYIYNFPFYSDYEKLNRFTGNDIENLKRRLEQMKFKSV